MSNEFSGEAPTFSTFRPRTRVMASELTTCVVASLAHVLKRMPDGRSALTRRERDVLRMLADGHTNESIGKALFISSDTARAQLATAMAKLGASRASACS